MKIDHIFICSTDPERDTKILTDFGLAEGPPNSHPGQGTANTRFFFQNIYIEFLYITDDVLAQSAITRPSKLYERITQAFGNPQISPFGFGIYPSDNGLKITDYTTWEYHPQFLPPPLKMDVFGNSLAEPMYYYMEFLSQTSQVSHKKYRHIHNFTHISTVKLHTPRSDLNNRFKQNLHDYEVIEYMPSQTHFLELEFNDGKQQKTHDFRPQLPLVFSW